MELQWQRKCWRNRDRRDFESACRRISGRSVTLRELARLFRRGVWRFIGPRSLVPGLSCSQTVRPQPHALDIAPHSLLRRMLAQDLEGQRPISFTECSKALVCPEVPSLRHTIPTPACCAAQHLPSIGSLQLPHTVLYQTASLQSHSLPGRTPSIDALGADMVPLRHRICRTAVIAHSSL
jgi:hypothetical protein